MTALSVKSMVWKMTLVNFKFMFRKEMSTRTMAESILLQIITSLFFLVTQPF